MARAATLDEDDVFDARRAAQRHLQHEFPRLEADHDDFIAEAIDYCAPKHSADRSFVAAVKAKAAKLAMDRLRRIEAGKRALDPIRTSRAPAPDRPLAGLREAVLAECRRRVREATGQDCAGFTIRREHLESQRDAAVVARRFAQDTKGNASIADGAWHSVALLCADTPPWHEFIVANRMRIGYVDAHGTLRWYGSTDAELAVLSLLSGSWPAGRG